MAKYRFFDDQVMNQYKNHGFKTVAMYQDYYQALGNVAEVARLLAGHDIVILNHPTSSTTSSWVHGILEDSGYPRIQTLIKNIKNFNPDIKIFGYVSATADASCSSNELNELYQASLLHTAYFKQSKSGVCLDFIKMVDVWLDLEKSTRVPIDGIFVDLLSYTQVTSYVRENCLSYLVSQNKQKMLNITVPTIEGAQFVLASEQLKVGDYILIESCFLDAGEFFTELTSPSAEVIKAIKSHSIPLNVVGLAYEKDNAPDFNHQLNASLYFENACKNGTHQTTDDAFGYAYPNYHSTIPQIWTKNLEDISIIGDWAGEDAD